MNPSAANATGRAPRCRSLPLIGMKPVAFAAAAALLPAALAGCSGSSSRKPAAGGQRPAGVQAVTISTTDEFRFAPSTATVRTGKVRITLTDSGSYPHNISFPALHVTSASVSGSPGQTSTTLLLTLTTPGRYDFVCTYHSSAGMKGTLVVLQGS